ncbi:MAG: TIGR04282 family arsenosugar biosynthesis glycosyltransferase [Thermodesulfobacteriota bacterium]
MPERDRKNILIVFVKYPEPGLVKTRIARDLGAQRAAEMYARMAKSVIENVSASDSYGTVIYFDPPHREKDVRGWLGTENASYEPQSGGELGERMSDAFERVFSKGAEKAVLIGTDVPDISGDTVTAAFSLLEETDVVTGPAADGGYYLLGLKSIEPSLFSDIEWGTSLVLNQTLNRINEKNLSHKTLDTLKDVDTINDVRPELLTPLSTE